jgi:Rrf2 family protein
MKEGAKLIITREIDYALRIFRVLSGGRKLTATEISEQEFVPLQFAYRILKKLEKSDFIRIIRGAKGGVVLNVDLREVSLFNLMTALDERRYVNACLQPEFHCGWREKHDGRCNFHDQLGVLQETLDSEFKKRSLHQMLFGA